MRKIILLLVCWFGFFCSAIACTKAVDPGNSGSAQTDKKTHDQFCGYFPQAAVCFCKLKAPKIFEHMKCRDVDIVYNSMMNWYKDRSGDRGKTLDNACRASDPNAAAQELCVRQWSYYRKQCRGLPL